MLLFNWVISRFHINLSGCNNWENVVETNKSNLQIQKFQVHVPKMKVLNLFCGVGFPLLPYMKGTKLTKQKPRAETTALGWVGFFGERVILSRFEQIEEANHSVLSKSTPPSSPNRNTSPS